MIKIIALGKLKEQYLKTLVNDYLTRINKYHKCEIIELSDLKEMIEEEKLILKNIKDSEYIITLDINGKKISSNELSDIIDKTFNQYSTITFIIGSSNGLSEKIKNKASLNISFGDITIPHGIFRGVLLEQIYRSFKIINNESYHK